MLSTALIKILGLLPSPQAPPDAIADHSGQRVASQNGRRGEASYQRCCQRHGRRSVCLERYFLAAAGVLDSPPSNGSKTIGTDFDDHASHHGRVLRLLRQGVGRVDDGLFRAGGVRIRHPVSMGSFLPGVKPRRHPRPASSRDGQSSLPGLLGAATPGRRAGSIQGEGVAAAGLAPRIRRAP